MNDLKAQKRKPVNASEETADNHAKEGCYPAAIKIYKEIVSDDSQSHITRAGVLRKLGNCYTYQWDFKQAIDSFEAALYLLDKCEIKNETWWSCWIDIQNDYCYAYHTTSQHGLLTDLVNKLKKIIHQKGTKKQRIKFLNVVYLDAMQRCRWYMPPEEVITLCEMAKQLAREEKDIPNEILALNAQSFAHMWRKETNEARSEAFLTMDMLKQFPNDEHIFRTFAIITYSYRLDNNVEDAYKWTQAALAYGKENNNKPLQHLHNGMLAWYHLKKGNIDQAEDLAAQTLEYLIAVRFPFLFTALSPLIFIATLKGNLEKAAAHAFLLLHPMAHRLPSSITTRLQEGLAFWGERKTKEAKESFSLAMAAADKEGYL